MSLRLLCRPSARKVLAHDEGEEQRKSPSIVAAKHVTASSSIKPPKKQSSREPSKKNVTGKKSLSSHLERNRSGRQSKQKKQGGDEEATTITWTSEPCLSPPRSIKKNRLVRQRSTDSEASTSSIKIKTQEESLQELYRGRSHDQNIGFSNVTIHYHELTLGDHPEVSQGVPVCLGEPATTTTTADDAPWPAAPLVDQVTVREHEREREQRCCADGGAGCWEDRARLSAKDRQRMLIEAGVPFQSIRNKMHCIKMQNHLQLRNRILTNLKEKGKNGSSPKASHC
mmetsp:Transcript_5337/g.10962  ORF Transcript_5337/g.10962 Transcript_5337/m.10962 type:complete len:284 (+) Transcript_5337:119-970(+)|eukprot:CAMPEP_0168815550 /NCGR_PEP_ID=MMETSP0726-20121227/6263_1 /TAXON_ID=265536 /ORGANISM="Amphiprora sp., Strain CCMP467" /LENGTH=283 /DNA_ID=CAMNT_0008867777 /DNA_START=19 /DNA_END=870 /DNA_ORIENTATION=+